MINMANLVEVKSMLRGVLMSAKEGIPAHILQRDYRALTEEALPFRKLGFNNLDDFIESIPDVVQIRRNNQGEIMYHAVASEQTAHIQKMVSKQRSTKKRGKLRAPQRRPTPRPILLSPPTHSRPYSRPPAPWEDHTSGRKIHVVLTDNRRGNSRRSVRFGENNQTFSVLRKAMDDANNQRKSQGFGARFEVPPRFRNQMPPEKPPWPSTADRSPPSSERTFSSGHKRPVSFKNVRDNLHTVPDGRRYRDIFMRYARDNDFLPIKFDTVSGKSGVTKGFVSSLQFQNKVYGSEDLFPSKEEAEYAVCKKICQELALDTRRSENPGFPGSRTAAVSNTELRSRVKDLLSSKEQGLWKKRLLELYREKYKEEPPDDLIGCIKTWTDIASVQESTVPDNEIIVPVKEPVITKPVTTATSVSTATKETISSPNTNSVISLPAETADKRIDAVKTPPKPAYHPSEYKYLKVPKATSLPYQEKVTVYITYIHSCAYFCLQREDSPIDEISEAIVQDAASKVCPRPSRSELIRGRFCAAVYSADESWSRAEVLNQETEGCGVEVLYIDYGNTEKCYPSSTQWLTEKTAAYPVQAIYCCLYGIQPLKDEEDWSNDSKKMFADVVQDKALTAVTKNYTVEGVCEVELFLPDNPTVSVNQILMDAKLVRQQSDEDVLEEQNEVEDDNQIQLDPNVEPEPLEFPDGNEYDVYVSYVNSTTESVMLRLVGEEYSEKLDELEAKLEKTFHDCPEECAFNVGSVCIAYVDTLFHRVRVIEMQEKKIVCEFLDHGDTDSLIPDQLRILDPKLNKSLSYQAIEVSLYGLEEVADNSLVLEKLFDLALGKTCVAEVMSRDNGLSVVLYDTFGLEDININESIVKALIAEAETSLLASHSSPADSLSSLADKFSDSLGSGPLSQEQSPVSSRKDTSAKIQEENSKSLKPADPTAVSSKSKPESGQSTGAISSTATSPSTSSSKFSKGSKDSSPQSKKAHVISSKPIGWRSPASPLKKSNSKESEDSWETDSGEEVDDGDDMEDWEEEVSDDAKINMIDKNENAIQNESRTKISESRTVENLGVGRDKLKISIPNTNIAEDSKTESNSATATPSSLYTWGDKSGNNKLTGAASKQITGSEDEANDLWNPEIYHQRKLPEKLKHPEKGEFYDVNVAFVFNPGNFVCTPYETLSELEELREQLKKYYESNPPSKLLEEEEIKIDHLYAGQMDDSWCRILTKQFVSQGLLSVYLPDIGEYNAVEVEELQPLPLQFWSLPFQAFRAKLDGLCPSKGAKVWSEASKYKLKECVEGKSMVGLVCGMDNDKISLKLVDTSTANTDICIDDLLIEMGVADIETK